jgi:hypothetical protein
MAIATPPISSTQHGARRASRPLQTSSPTGRPEPQSPWSHCRARGKRTFGPLGPTAAGEVGVASVCGWGCGGSVDRKVHCPGVVAVAQPDRAGRWVGRDDRGRQDDHSPWRARHIGLGAIQFAHRRSVQTGAVPGTLSGSLASKVTGFEPRSRCTARRGSPS